MYCANAEFLILWRCLLTLKWRWAHKRELWCRRILHENSVYLHIYVYRPLHWVTIEMRTVSKKRERDVSRDKSTVGGFGRILGVADARGKHLKSENVCHSKPVIENVGCHLSNTLQLYGVMCEISAGKTDRKMRKGWNVCSREPCCVKVTNENSTFFYLLLSHSLVENFSTVSFWCNRVTLVCDAAEITSRNVIPTLSSRLADSPGHWLTYKRAWDLRKLTAGFFIHPFNLFTYPTPNPPLILFFLFF